MLRIFHDFSMEIFMHVMIGGLSQKKAIHGLQEVGLLESSWLFFWIPEYITPEQRSKPLRHYM